LPSEKARGRALTYKFPQIFHLEQAVPTKYRDRSHWLLANSTITPIASIRS